tara:strand:- start:4298 stop:5536 length:1239 start_codon:yes stop_codon:yes gene_type:complete
MNWEEVKIGEIATLINGRGFKPHEWSSTGLPIIRIQNLNGSSEFNFYTGEFAEKIRVRQGDLLFAWSGSRGSSFGPHFWKRSENGLLNYHIWRIECSERVDKLFFFAVLQQLTLQIESDAHGAAGLVHTQKNIVEKWKVRLPSMPVQRKIAAILTTIDRKIEIQEKLIEARTERQRGLRQQLLSGATRFPEYRNKPWVERRLEDVAQNESQRNGSRFGTDRLYGVTKTEGVIPMREHVKGEKFERCKLVEPNWFAYNPMRLNIGSIARWQGEREVMVSGDYVVFSCDERLLAPEYLDHLRRTRLWEHFVNASGNGSVRVRIYFKDLGRIRFSLPPIEEQRRIAQLLDTGDREIVLLKRQLHALREQKRGLMQKLLTGEWKVSVDEEADVPKPRKKAKKKDKASRKQTRRRKK